MATPNLPQMDPGGEMTHNIPPRTYASPYADLWFTQSVVSGIDREMMGWLTAQGWQVSSVASDTSTSPPTPSYTMTRRGMNNWLILQELMFSLTVAYNEGREMNYLRYRDIITVWNQAFAQSQQHYQEMTEKSDADVVVYFGEFLNDMQEISTQIGLARSEALAESDRVATQLQLYVDKLGDIEVNYQNHAVIVNALLTRQETALNAYLAAYNTKLDTLDAEYATHTGALDDLLAALTSDQESHITGQLEAFDTLLDDYTNHESDLEAIENSLQATVVAHNSQIETLLSSLLSDYNALDSSIDSSLASLSSAFGSHSASYEEILDDLLSDFTTHAATTRALLVDLGTTELARINQDFDARLADVAQKLVDRGFYSSGLLNDHQDRVERERSQAIVELNDRLAREKLANEHQLFAEQDKMRARSLDGKAQLYGVEQDVLRYEAQAAYQLFGSIQGVRERTISGRQALYGVKDQFARFQAQIASGLEAQLQAVRTRTIEGKDRIQILRDTLAKAKMQNNSQTFAELSTIRRQQIEANTQTYSATQDVTRNITDQRDKLLAQIQSAVAAVLDGRAKYSQMSLQKGEYLSDLRVKLNVQLMEIAARSLQMRQGTSQAELELMKYQVDSRNNFLVGMFRVIEGRTDEYPDVSEISKLAFALGDAGSGWVSP